MSTATQDKKKGDFKETEQKSLEAPELAIWLMPRLREYAQKLNELSERATHFPMNTSPHMFSAFERLFIAEYMRVISTYWTLSLGITKMIKSASSILDHTRLDLEIEEELELRTQEALTALNSCQYTMKTTVEYLKVNGLQNSLAQALKDHQIKLPV